MTQAALCYSGSSSRTADQRLFPSPWTTKSIPFGQDCSSGDARGGAVSSAVKNSSPAWASGFRLLLLYGVLVGLAWCLLWPKGCLAAEDKPAAQADSAPPAKTPSQELRFIRVYAPADRVGQWPWGDMKYVPVDGAEFERLIRLGEESASELSQQPRIGRIQCWAALSGPSLLEGESTWTIHLPTQQAGVLRWAKYPLAVRTAVWLDREGKALEPALLGLNESGQTELVVVRGGQLRVQWSLQGQQDSRGVRFDLWTPACPHTELVLDLPENLRPVFPGVLIRPQEPASGPGRKSWLLEWAGPSPGPLRLVGQQEGTQSAKMLVQQESRYTLSPDGLEGLVRLVVQDLGEPIGELCLLVDGKLEVTAVKLGEQNLSWRWDTGSGPATRRLWVLLPQPISQQTQSLEVELLAPVVLGASWQLPRIRLEGAIWQQGSLALRVGSDLQVQRISCTGCRQSKAEPAAPESTPGAEYFEFQAYSPDAAVEVVLAQGQPLPQVDTGSVVRFSERQINVRVRANVRAERGEHFILQAQVGRRWLIDAVEADPSTQVADWTLDPTRQRLTIHLARPVTAQRPVSLQIVGRRLQSPVGRTWRIEDLLPLRFTGIQEGKHLVALCPPEGSYELICLTPEPSLSLNPRQLKETDWELVDKVSDGFLFFATPEAQSLQWVLRPQIARYRAKLQVDVTASAKSVSERYRIQCTPDNSRVERVVVVFSHARPEPIQWMVGGDTERLWSARRLTDKDLPQDQLPAGGEAWEIQLRPSRSEAFTILGQRNTPLAGDSPVPLLFLPQAVQQEATVRIRTVGPESPQIVSRRLTPIPPGEEDFVPGWTTQLANFRYDPKQELSVAQGPALLLRPWQEPGACRQSWVWQARLESWLQPNGLARHIATYWLVNFHRNQLNLQLPSEAGPTQMEGVWLNGQPARWQVQKTAQQTPLRLGLEVNLPPERTFSTLVIAFQTQQSPLRHRSKVRPCLPSPDVPVLSGSWTVWLPPDWEARCPPEYTLQPDRPDLSLGQRLFGIWARPRHRQPFDPFLPEDWQRLVGQDPLLQRDRQQAETFFQTLGALLRKPPLKTSQADSTASSSAAGQRWTWAALLQQESLSQVGKILIDRQGLWEAGIDPGSVVWVWASSTVDGEPTGQAETRLARQAFWQARLALGLYQGMILITSLERASGWLSWEQNLADPLVWRISPELGDRLLELASLSTEPLFVPPDTWQESAQPSAAEVVRPVEWASGAGLLGWRAYPMEAPPSALSAQSLEIELLDHDQAQAWYWAAFLTTSGLALVLAKRNWFWLLVSAGLLAGVALAAPESWVAPASGALGGVLLALVVGLFRGRTNPAAETLPSGGAGPEGTSAWACGESSSGRVITVGIVLMGVVLAEAAFAGEASPTVAPSGGSGSLYRVFIPIDDNQQPTGDPYQVPEPFYQYLRRRAQTTAPSASGWRLRQALYRAELTRSPTTGRWEIPRLHLSWQCDLVGKLAQVSLPLVREQFPMVAGSWLVEGQPIEPQWNEAGTMLVLPMPVSAPTVRVEGQVRPMPWEQAGQQGIELGIPPTPDARLELSLPPDAPELHLEGALGMVSRVADPTPRLVAELGPTTHLSLRWAASLPTPPKVTTPEVDQLLWLRVYPGAVLLDARFRISGAEGAGVPPTLRLLAENRLRLVWWQTMGSPSDPKNSNIKISSSPGGQIFEFPLLPAAPDQTAVLALRLLLTDTTGLGTLRLPKLEPLDLSAKRRWLAVSVDQSLEYPEPLPSRAHAVAVEEFLNLWGSADLPPQFVDNLATLGAAWTLVSRPRTPNTSVEQTLWLSYGEKNIQVSYEARLTTTSGSCFQHRLQTPADLQIDSISILQSNVAQPVRWTRTEDGKLSVFSYKPLTGRYELHLTGTCPNGLSQRRPIPYVEIEGAETEWATLVLCRQPEVLLRLLKAEGLTEMEPPPAMETKSSFGRLVKTFAVDPRQIADVELQTVPNRPQIACQQITLVRPGTEQWQAEVQLLLQVQKGLVDEILLEAPPCWPGPYKTTPQVSIATKELSEGRRGIVLRPPAAIDQTYRIRVAGPIHWSKTGPQDVPAILPLALPISEHLILLPTQDQLRPLVWDIQGLEKTLLPEGMDLEWLGQGTWQPYRIVAGQWKARLQPLAEQTPMPEVRLADIRLRWETDRTCAGKASFYLLPAGQQRCVLCLPPEFRLLEVQVDNNPSAPLLLEQGNRYSLLLGSSMLPQVVEVSFLGTLPTGTLDGIQPFPAPWIENWPVATTLWTIYPPAGYELAEPEGAGRLSPLRLDAYRLRSIGGLLETGCRQWSEPREDFLRWHRVWADRFSAILRQVQRDLALPPATELHRTLRAEAQSFQLKLAQLAESLGAAEAQRNSATLRAGSADEADLWFDWLRQRGAVCRAVLQAPSQGLLVAYRPKTTSATFWRWVAAAGLACAAIALTWAGSNLLRRWGWVPWPHLLGLLAGGIWWLWLWPSALGWAFILLALLGGFRTGFPSVRPRRTDWRL